MNLCRYIFSRLAGYTYLNVQMIMPVIGICNPNSLYYKDLQSAMLFYLNQSHIQ